MIKFLLLFFVLLLAAFCVSCSHPAAHSARDASSKHEIVKREVINKLHNTPQVKKREFDELVDWVVEEVHERMKVPNTKNVKYSIMKRYDEEKFNQKDYDQLIDWVIDEVNNQIKSGGSILPAHDETPEREAPELRKIHLYNKSDLPSFEN